MDELSRTADTVAVEAATLCGGDPIPARASLVCRAGRGIIRFWAAAQALPTEPTAQGTTAAFASSSLLDGAALEALLGAPPIPLTVVFAPGLLVTVHDQALPAVDRVVAGWRDTRDAVRQGVPALLCALLDALVGDYFPVLDRTIERVDALEAVLFAADGRRFRTYDIRRLYAF